MRSTARERRVYEQKVAQWGRCAAKQSEGVGQHVEDRAELFDAPLRGAGRVADDGLPADAGDAARQTAERAGDELHRLGQSGRLGGR